jgi:hypothetical protein
MSKLRPSFLATCTFIALSAIGAYSAAQAPDLKVHIELVTDNGARKAVVRGLFQTARLPQFRKSFSLAHLPRDRGVSGVAFFDEKGLPVKFRELSAREYLAEAEIHGWTYALDLTVGKDRKQAAHSSWLADTQGILMMRDLCPDLGRSYHAHVDVTPPDGWSVMAERTVPASAVAPIPGQTNPAGWFLFSRDTVIGVGKGWRSYEVGDDGVNLDIALSGSWHFSDVEMTMMASEVMRQYTKLFGTSLQSNLVMARFPVQVPPGEWQAETRAGNVTIISSDMPFRTPSLQRLHEQLRHELFHLWIPKDVGLTGDYDWFYEGFALYKSLKLAVALNRIRFEDFLDTLSRAHTIDSAFTQRPSLIEASKKRFTGLNTQVYARGMLVAFLIDLRLMDRSRSSIDDVLRKVYSEHRLGRSAEVDGNEAVIAILRANQELQSIVTNYIEGTATIDLTSEPVLAGLVDVDAGPITTLRVKEKPGGRQRALLDKLGYNNWRKLSQNPK